MNKYIIDLDEDPFLEEDRNIEYHHRQGKIEWDATKAALHLAEGQKNGITGHELRNRFREGMLALNANALDYLLVFQMLIPEEWKGKTIFFWGTIYRGWLGGFFVRGLYYRGDNRGWRDEFVSLDRCFGHDDPALIFPPKAGTVPESKYLWI